MMVRQYILKNGKPVPEPDLVTWARWFETAERKVKETKVRGELVSTIFLGLDHNYTHKGPPVLWETMVFGGGKHHGYQQRCAGSKEQAEAMHEFVVKAIQQKTLD